MTTLNAQPSLFGTLSHAGESVTEIFRSIGRGLLAAQQLRANYLVSEHLVGTAEYKGMTQHQIAAQLNQAVIRSL